MQGREGKEKAVGEATRVQVCGAAQRPPRSFSRYTRACLKYVVSRKVGKRRRAGARCKGRWKPRVRRSR